MINQIIVKPYENKKVIILLQIINIIFLNHWTDCVGKLKFLILRRQ